MEYKQGCPVRCYPGKKVPWTWRGWIIVDMETSCLIESEDGQRGLVMHKDIKILKRGMWRKISL